MADTLYKEDVGEEEEEVEEEEEEVEEEVEGLEGETEEEETPLGASLVEEVGIIYTDLGLMSLKIWQERTQQKLLRHLTMT